MNGYCHGLDFESKKGRSEGSKRHTSSDCVPMQTGYLKRTESVQVPILDDPVQKVEEIKLPSVNFEELSLPQPSELSQKRNFSESNNLFDLDPFLSGGQVSPLDNDLKLKADELNSMNDYYRLTKQSVDSMDNILPESMSMDDIILELQRQTVHSIMDEIGNISDILAASQLDMYNTQDLSLPLEDSDLALPSSVIGDQDLLQIDSLL